MMGWKSSPLTIAQPRSARWFELCETAWTQAEPTLGCGDRCYREPCDMSPDERRAKIAALLEENGEMSTEAIRAALGLGETHVAHFLWKMGKEGILVWRWDRVNKWDFRRGHVPVGRVKLWSLA